MTLDYSSGVLCFLTIYAEAADFQLMVEGFEFLGAAQPVYGVLQDCVFGEGNYTATINAG